MTQPLGLFQSIKLWTEDANLAFHPIYRHIYLFRNGDSRGHGHDCFLMPTHTQRRTITKKKKSVTVASDA